MPKRVAQTRGVCPVKHFCGGLDLFCAGLDRPSQHCLIVINKDVKARARVPKLSWLAVEFAVWVPDHQHRAIDGDFSMQNLSVWVGDPEQLDRSEGLPVKVDSA
ncbi:MAG TPA: hypothetical protein VIW23_01985 [Candidatus Acidoferrum sp.]